MSPHQESAFSVEQFCRPRRFTHSLSPWKTSGSTTATSSTEHIAIGRRSASSPSTSLHSYAQVYLDGAFVGSLDRRLRKDGPGAARRHTRPQLDILVEDPGRVNFSIVLRGERAGITKQVLWQGNPLEHWSDLFAPHEHPRRAYVHARALYGTVLLSHGHFTLSRAGDTFLDVRALGKGAVWINGHALGRFWDIGPQQTLYVPGRG